MANQIYGYNPSSYGGGGGGGGGSSLSSIYTSRSATDPYSLSDQRYIPSSGPFSSSSDSFDHSKYERAAASLYQTDALRYASTGTGITTAAGAYPGSRIFGADAAPSVSKPLTSWPGIDVGSTYDYESVLAGMKRHNEAFYHQSVMGNHNSIGQSEALFSTNTLAKRPRLESATNLPVYPQRPGEKDCAHYMLTRTCKFGESCKFDHPIWVPEGGIPDWKEVPLVPSSESLPERPGVPDCPYFLKTQKCKFGFKCKFNHPKDKVVSLGDVETVDVSVLPERPSEPPCSFYVKTGKCKFGATCKFHHPKDIEVPQSNEEHGNGVQSEAAVKSDEITAGDATLKPFTPFTPASLHNSKGLPVRPGEVDCPFYLKTGSCKYGATCRYNHPDRSAINPSIAAGLNNAFISSPAANLNFGVINPAASFLPSMDPRLAQTTLGVSPTIFSQQPGVSPNIYPQRPGQMECDFYMKTGECKFGERCKFHHPLDRSAPTPSMTKQALQQNVKLTLAGLPRREGAIICPFYMKTATCKYGVTCRFDHPPPGEAIAMASAQGTSGTVGEQEGDKVAETTGEPQGTSELQFYN